MADKSWKAFERRLCRDMGIERQAVTGERDGADNKPHPMFSFQFKLRRSIPKWLSLWLGGIRTVADKSGKIGVLVVKRPRVLDDDAIVIVGWKEWCDLHGVPE